ncbi:MFS transporter [Microbacterium sp. zg.Y625]|uniref:MFS transporter n=1 Tax=Microbacterium jiangjiandongii TaxID=3049071 RepID=UPI00214BD8A8|nr:MULTISPECIES: MFS transporter [unclassified Microbacterium]MCR2793568.1 MFS transporter [Microbacterium sp. zg.Y625]WIM25922.1 MFS transporter [Microbacterium sp. zg-Y625]
MYISLTNAPDAAERARPDGPRGARTVSSTVVTLGIVSLLTDISSESVAAVLPLYITGVLGLSTIAFGVLDGLYQGVSAVVRIAGGYASDRLDQPKWVAFTGYALAAAARVGLLFASGFAAITGVVTADRIGKGIRTAPRDALIAASSEPESLGRAFGVHRMLDNIGAALGPLIAFVILLIVPDGFHIVFTASLAFALIGVLVLGLVVPNVRTRPARRAADRGRRAASRRFAWRRLWSGRMRRVLAGAGILGILTIGDGFVYLVLQARSDFAAQWFPLLYVGTNVVFLACAIPLGRLADRVGRARVFVVGHFALLGAYAVAALAIDDLVATVLCLVFLGAFYAATDGVLAALAAETTSPQTRATGIAAVQTVVAVTRFASAAGFGVLWYALGREPAMIAVAVLLAVAIPVAALVLRPFLSATGRAVS